MALTGVELLLLSVACVLVLVAGCMIEASLTPRRLRPGEQGVERDAFPLLYGAGMTSRTASVVTAAFVTIPAARVVRISRAGSKEPRVRVVVPWTSEWRPRRRRQLAEELAEELGRLRVGGPWEVRVTWR